MDSYLSNQLGLPYKKINDFVLVDIARNDDQEYIIQLVKLIVFIILNCPQKDQFVEKIMKLGETDQFLLMNFIQSIMKDKKDFDDKNINENEVAELRRSNSLLVAQLGKVELSLRAVTEEKQKLLEKNDQISLLNIDLEQNLSSNTKMHSIEHLEVCYKLEKELIRKNTMLETTKQVLEKSRRNSEIEVAQYREELDEAKLNSSRLVKSELKIERLNERLEKMASLKTKYKDLKVSNKSLQQLIKEHQHESNAFSKSRAKIAGIQEALTQEKSRTTMLIQNLETKYQLTAKYNTDIRRLKEKIVSLEYQLMDQCMSIASSLVSDDSLHLNGIEALIDSDVVLEEFHQSEKNPRQEAQIIANLLRDQQSHKTKMAEKKEKIHRLREVLQMQREEFMANKF